ncbi:MAG: 3-isopropylmalate dehydratase small subunit [Vallitaleaceae bacterium]|jgi:3-isopropylmalate/(R)-2-methylmalate dehydratase small subunit|nr:3-isopropylmalate dehydratase small subunit [Vallitaleaceae bacterium]
MKPYKKFTGIVSPFDRMNVDTDAIIPKQFLKRIERTGFGEYLFYEFRFDQSGKLITDFILNQERYQGTSILLSRANFGCGSSREHAPWALSDYGYKVIIAPSYADIFYNNCFNNGILPITLTGDIMDGLFEKCENEPGYSMEVDLENLVIKDSDGLVIEFELESSRQEKLLKGLDDISMTLAHIDKIKAFELTHIIY